MSHTPGPWRFGAVGGTVIAPHGPGDPMRPGGVDEYGGSLVAEGVSRPADGRLIVAAPALLEALRACDRALACWQVGAVPGRPEAILALILKIRAAIALATREERR